MPENNQADTSVNITDATFDGKTITITGNLLYDGKGIEFDPAFTDELQTLRIENDRISRLNKTLIDQQSFYERLLDGEVKKVEILRSKLDIAKDAHAYQLRVNTTQVGKISDLENSLNVAKQDLKNARLRLNNGSLHVANLNHKIAELEQDIKHKDSWILSNLESRGLTGSGITYTVGEAQSRLLLKGEEKPKATEINSFVVNRKQ